MPESIRTFFAAPALRRRLGLLGLVLLAAWVTFFDSHSLVRRAAFLMEHRALRAENTALQEAIEQREAELAAPLTNATVERLAREQYGMRRPGETVYRTEAED
ncbi:MAG: septum formation initiator family protein [Bacteroidota bacterium]